MTDPRASGWKEVGEAVLTAILTTLATAAAEWLVEQWKSAQERRREERRAGAGKDNH